jgi:dihydrofolate reductase
MRKLIVSLAVSLDGFIEGPNGEYDWCHNDPEYDMKNFLAEIDTIFMGRKTYEKINALGGNPPGFPKFKEYVFSTNLINVDKETILIGNDIKPEVQKIKQQRGKNIWLFGGSGLTTSLMNMKLVDELILAVYPIVLAGGKPLFENIDSRVNLSLKEAKTFPTGIVLLTYTVLK